MKAMIYRAFGGAVQVENLPEPICPDDGVIVEVMATGLCRSDWHGWMGHDPDIVLPHVPGHELAGVVRAVGKNVRRWRGGERVTVPFVSGCGRCSHCARGDQQVCDTQFQPGFTAWGSFAQFVALDYADGNVVALPDELDFVTAASLGCRFVTAFRAVVDLAQVRGGEWVAVHGCGGVGLAAVMIAAALGAKPIAVDIRDDALALAAACGAVATVNGTAGDSVAQIMALTQGGAHVSLDALGSPQTCYNSIANLRKRGRHIQVGLLGGHADPPIPMGKVIAHELEIYGSHGMQAHRYPALFGMMAAGTLRPEKLVGRTIALDEAPHELINMNHFQQTGVTVIDRF